MARDESMAMSPAVPTVFRARRPKILLLGS